MRVVLLSGGVDSTVALANELDRGHTCHAVTFDYNQTHVREIDSARAVAKHYGVAHEVIELPVFTGSALTGDADIPQAHAERVDATYVPARNTVFLSIAAALAESLGAGFVVYGANYEDHKGYPDCRPEFIVAMNDLLMAGMKHPVWIHAPFVAMTKNDIIELGRQLDAPLDLTWSCYRGGSKPCGQCGACA